MYMNPLDHPDILPSVLDFCDGRNLSNALQVNHLWNQVATRLLNKRRHFYSLLAKEKTIRLCGEKICNFLGRVRCIPAGVMVFAFRAGNRKSYQRALSSIHRKLPCGAKMIGCDGDGIIGSNGCGIPEEIMEDDGSETCLSCLVIPKVPGVVVQTYKGGEDLPDPFCCQDELRASDYGTTFEGFDFSSVKLVVSLSTVSLNPLLALTSVPNTFHLYLQSACGNDTQVVGGVPEDGSIFVNGVADREIMLAGMALGGDSFSYGTLVTNGNKLEIANSLEDLAVQVHTSDIKNMACFLCICVGRGEDFHGAKNVESQLVQKAFPGIPISGFFGQGEIGEIGTHSFLPLKSSQKSDQLSTPLQPTPKKSRRNRKRNLAQGYTSAYGFMLIHPARQSTSSP